MSREAIERRHSQGWVMEITDDLDDILEKIRRAKSDRRPLSVGYHGNVVDLWCVEIFLFIFDVVLNARNLKKNEQ